MRQAYSSQHGYGHYGSQSDPVGAAYAGDGDRLSSLKRALHAIEQRVAGVQMQPPVPPYAQMPQQHFPVQNSPVQNPMMNQPGFGHGASSVAELGMLQEQINRLSGQVGMQAYQPQQVFPGNDINAAAAEVARRQQILNAGHSGSVPQPQPQPQPNAQLQPQAPVQPQPRPQPRAQHQPEPRIDGMDLIGRHLNELKRELTSLKKEVAKPVSVKQEVPQDEINRIAGAIADLQKGTQFDEKAFERLNKELEDLRVGMKQDMRRAVRKELEAGSDAAQIADLAQRLDKLTNGLGDLSQGNDAAQIADLATRLDKLTTGLGEISQSDDGAQIAGLSTRLDELSIGLGGISQSIDSVSVQSANAFTPRVDNLASQLDALRMTVDDLPQTLAISRLEERLSDLTSKMDHLADASQNQTQAQPQGMAGEDIAAIEGRLDEISRALVAVSNMGKKAPTVDLSAVDRIEARMAELGRTIDDIAAKDSGAELEQLAVRIEGLTERLGSFEKYAESGDLGGASAMFAAPDTGAIEEQLRNLNAMVEQSNAMVEQSAAQSQTQQLEEQISQLAARVEETANVNSTAAQMSNLEAQVGQIIRQMSKQTATEAPAPVDFSPMEARFGQIEHQLATTQNFSLEAAQQAAQQAVAMMGPQSEAGQIIGALSEDLKSLQMAAENGNAQNAHTVLEVQQTLQQVVERLGTIEGAIEDAAQAQSMARTAQVIAEPKPVEPQPQPMAIPTAPYVPELADETAFAADSDADLGVIHKAAVDTGFMEPPVGAEPPIGAPVNDGQARFDAPPLDPTDHIERTMAFSSEDNAPLEPGSAAPDIERLVEQASEKLNEATASLPGTGADGSLAHARPNDEMRPDAVAAARRALQATTAEMDAVREEVALDKKPGAGGLQEKLSKLLPSVDFDKLRKPLVMGAAALLLAIVAWQGVGMFSGPNTDPVANLEVPAIEMNAADGGLSGGPSVSETTVDAAVADREVRSVDEDTSSASPEMKADASPEVMDAGTPEAPVPTEMAAKDSTEPEAAETNPAETDPAKPMETSLPVEDAETPEATPAPDSSNATFDVPANAGPAALVAAASSGDPKALFQIGMRYSDGNDVKRNMVESAKWFRHAADTGFAPAQYSIGSLYEKGIGVKRDVTKAAQWYEKAAQQGNARAMHNLAVIHAMGNPPSVQPNMDKAVGWFQKAADYGIKDSQFNLGILYGQGMGVPQNLGDSYKWFALAAKTGDTDAGKKRDEVANAMDPNDLDDARKVVNDWAPKKLIDAVNRVALPEEWRGKGTRPKTTAVQTGESAIKKAQLLLNQRGFSVGTPDGVIGPKTKQAIMEFQRNAGIPITGKVDQKTLKALDLQT